MMMLVSTGLTWIGLIGLAFSSALLLFRLPAFEPAGSPVPIARLVRTGTGLLGPALALLAVSSAGDLFLRTAEMSSTPVPAVLPVLPTVLLSTHYGTIWLVRMACLLLLFVLLALKRAGGSVPGRVVMLGLIVVAAWTFSASGHAAEKGDLSIKELADVVHLLSASFWGGGVIALAFVILPSFRVQADLIRIAAVTRRFSRVAGYAVVLVLISALYNIKAYVGEFSSLLRTAYGLTVLAKMLLLYFLLLLGALNRYLGVPLLEHAAGGRFEGRGLIMQLIDRILTGARGHLSPYVISIFRRIVTIEAILMLVVFLCAALLKHQTPPRHLNSQRSGHQVQTSVPPPPALPGAGQPARTLP